MTTWSAPTPSSARAAMPPSCASTAPTKALAITTDCTPRYCYADPYEGGKQAIAEAWRNLTAVGATPLAVTNCLNFGNPQRPEIMGQFVGCIEGMAEACRALDFPIVSGNVSPLQRDQERGWRGQRDPADARDRRHRTARGLDEVVAIGFKAGRHHLLIGDAPAAIWASRCGCAKCTAARTAPPPPVDLAAERRTGEFVRERHRGGWITAVPRRFRRRRRGRNRGDGAGRRNRRA